MNNLNNSVDDVVECPLCMEPLEVDDLNFFPCTCGYQICRFCWHRIRTDENELCPACRKEYPENPADFKPLTQEEMIAFKSQKRQRDQQRKQKITENRKHLANVRVVQKNLVFVVGLPPRLADADILKKHEYFGKYGKIHKVVINPSTAYAGVQGPSASAYVTYVHNADALRAIQSVNNIMIDGRLIKTSLGTTKYCSHFMKNQQCPKGDCMYLHELGDPEASFTKEEMHQGKHQEYEKRLHDVLIASSGSNSGGSAASISVTNSTSSNNKNSEINKISSTVSNTTTSTGISTSSTSTTIGNTSSSIGSAPQKEAWPSLSVSPVNTKELLSSSGNKHKKDRSKQEKSKIEKPTKLKSQKNNGSNSLCKDGDISVVISNSVFESSATSNNISNEQVNKSKIEKSKDRNQTKKEAITSAIEVKDFEDHAKTSNTTCDFNKNRNGSDIPKADSLLSINTSSNNSTSCSIPANEYNSIVNESTSDKSTTGSFNENSIVDEHTNYNEKTNNLLISNAKLETKKDSEKIGLLDDDLFVHNTAPTDSNVGQRNNHIDGGETENEIDDNNYLVKDKITNNSLLRGSKNADAITDSMSHLKLFDGNSFFSSTTDIITETSQMKHIEDGIHNQLSSGNAPNLPDLITGIDGYQNTTNEWEEALKSVMFKTNKQMEEKLQQNLQQQQLQNQNNKKHQEDLNKIQEFQKHNIISSLSLSQLNGIQSDIQSISNNYLTGSELNRQSSFLQQQLLQHQSNQNLNENTLHNSLFGTNMSKFFDFHKHQQQKLQQHCLQMNGSNNLSGSLINESFNVLPVVDNNRLNSQLVDQNCSMSSQQHHKQNVFGKIDQMLCHQTLQQSQQIGPSPPQQNQYMHSSTGDDDLGFDPFIETQKALAELIENEEEQQNTGSTSSSKLMPHNKASNLQQPQQQHIIDYMQRARMPPPGFNHVNNFSSYGVVPRLQNNSKIMPFMNLSNNYTVPSSQHMQHQQQQLQIPSNAWNTHLGNFQQHITEQQIRQVNSNQISSSSNQKGYTGNDWTAMDPAILSFRQFSFPPQTQITPQLQPQQQEMFLQQLAQQQQQTGFNSPSQHLGGGNVGLPNAMLNTQPSSQQHVNANVQGMLEYLKTRQFV